MNRARSVRPPYAAAAIAACLAYAAAASALAAPAHFTARPDPSSLERPATVGCATWSLRETVGEDAWAAAAGARERGALPCDHTPVGPPPNPQIGDSWNWYIWQLAGFPVATLQSCTVRGMGEHCYVVVQDTQWNVTMNQAKVDAIVEAFENSSIGPFPTQGIWDLNTSHFGMPPDPLDQDPRVYILYYDFDVSSDGFFWGFDQECDDTAQFHSNECDVVYMNCSVFDPAGDYLLAVLAHELQHLIHSNYDANEEAWVDEGLGELAMWLYGNPDNVVQFNGNPDRQLNSFSGNFYDYVKTYLWTLYFYERYGGQPAISALVGKPQNGIAGFEAVLDDFFFPENFADVFSDWVVANFLDDTTIGDGRYGYAGETLPAFNPIGTFSGYPVGPIASSVNHWAADYARFSSFQWILASFDGSNNALFRVRALLLDSVTPTEVLDVELDASQFGSISLPLGVDHEEAVMVYSKASGTGGLAYTYDANLDAVAAPVAAPPPGFALAVLGSVSARPAISYVIPAEAANDLARLEIVDVAGRVVRRFAPLPSASGRHELSWDGRDDGGASAAPGTYFVRLVAGTNSATARLTLLR